MSESTNEHLESLDDSSEETSQDSSGLDIAVIGMAGRFPGAPDVNTFWENLENGVESIVFYTDDELLEAGIEQELLDNPDYVKCGGGALQDKEYFDATFFGYSAVEAGLMDPQLRLFHECAWHALEDAGYNPHTYHGLIGIYGGSSLNLYWEALSLVSGQIDVLGGFAGGLLVDRDYLCTRVAYNLNLKGPAVVVKSACSTSLVSVHMACQALLSGECDIALAGGVTILRLTKHGYVYQDDLIGSSDGHCRAFDAEASGTVGGDGVGLVVLKPLEEAMNDRDTIHAVIKGSAINNDGFRKAGYTAPSIEGQMEVICDARELAEVDPETITYLETHGTGTVMGDPIEIEALKKAFDTDKKQFCRIGAVKSNIGHLDSAAGIAGLIKTILALKHKKIPPSLHYKSPNPKIDFANSPFMVNAELTDWETGDTPRRAGVSSFGIGGTNAHAVLEEAPEDYPNQSSLEPGDRKKYQLLPLSAKTSAALDRMTANLGNYLKENPGMNIEDAAYTLQIGRRAFNYRRFAVCTGLDEAAEALSAPVGDSPLVRSGVAKDGTKSVIFMFPGIGGQYAGMGRELYDTEPLFREEMDKCFDILNPLLGFTVKDVLYPADSGSGDGKVSEFQTAQAVIFALEYALAKLIMSWGVKPAGMTGYSFGEYTAACLSGVMTLEDALKLIVERGKLIASMTEGAMFSVPLPAAEVEAMLPDGLSIAIDNGPSCIVAGTEDGIKAFENTLKSKRLMGMRVPNSYALHSKLMEPVLEQFEKKVAAIELNRPEIPYISNVTGTWITVQEAQDPGYWAKHMRETVRFADGIEVLKKETAPIFIEVGPGRDLLAMLARHKEEEASLRAVNLVPTPQQKLPGDRYFLSRMGQLWLYGIDIEWAVLHGEKELYRVPLPGYPFEKHRFWFDGNPLAEGDGLVLGGNHLRKKCDMADWFYVPQWTRAALATGEPAFPATGGQWLAFTDNTVLAGAIAHHLEKAGHNLLTVTIGAEYASNAEDNGGKATSYTIDPANPEHYDRLFKELAGAHTVPDRIINLWPVANDSLDTGLHDLMSTVRAIGGSGIYDNIRFGVVSSGMLPVTGDEDLCPEKATLLGPVKIISLEYPNISTLAVDITNPGDDKAKAGYIAENLLKEFDAAYPDYRIVAYRGMYRWIESYEAVQLNRRPEAPAPRIEENGVYMITGGFGGMGFALAEDFSINYKANLVLVDKFDYPSIEGLDQWLTGDDRKADIEKKKEKIKRWQDDGANVLVIDGDVTDLDCMSGAVSQTVEQFGRIDGVIHAAGLIDYAGVIQRRSIEATDALLSAKITGARVLEKALEGHETKFIALFSSITNLFPALTFGQVSYTSGHEFLDAFCYHLQKQGRFAVTIDWNTWSEVGMVTRAMEQRKALRSAADMAEDDEDIMLITPEEGIEAFYRVLDNDHRRVIVFNRNLDRAIESFAHPETLEQEASERTGGGAGIERPELDTPYEAPGTDAEKTIVDIWQTLFGFSKLGVLDDFFEIGGDSLVGATMLTRINKELGARIPLAELYSAPTPRTLAALIASKGEDRFKDVDETLTLFKENPDSERHFFFVHNGYGATSSYFEWANNLEVCDTFNLWGINGDPIKNYAPFNTTFEAIAQRNVEKVKSVQPEGPYYIGGWCMGGIFAYALVRELEKLGEEVKLFAVFDAPSPQWNFGNVEVEYTLEDEIKWLSNGLPPEQVKQLTAGATNVEEIWATMVNFLEETQFDIDLIRSLVPQEMVAAFPGFENLTRSELIYYMNTIRTNGRADAKYIPDGKCQVPTIMFEAGDSDYMTGHNYWTKYCDKIIETIDIPGDHFSMFRTPAVEVFAKKFDDFIRDFMVDDK